jgi:hypothetical protein
MSFKKGYSDRKEWVKLARGLDYDFKDVQKVYTKISLNISCLCFRARITYALGNLAYWLFHEPALLTDFEVKQLERDKERWLKEGRNLIELEYIRA